MLYISKLDTENDIEQLLKLFVNDIDKLDIFNTTIYLYLINLCINVEESDKEDDNEEDEFEKLKKAKQGLSKKIKDFGYMDFIVQLTSREINLNYKDCMDMNLQEVRYYNEALSALFKKSESQNNNGNIRSIDEMNIQNM